MKLELDLDKLSEDLKRKLFDLLVSRFDETDKECSEVRAKANEFSKYMSDHDGLLACVAEFECVEELHKLENLFEEKKDIIKEHTELDNVLKNFNTYLSYKSRMRNKQ
jgi:hypothetical protein